ncbi:MFS transporter [Ktedonosporobacter rubrisoli]|uniref:MFS transporter n=1 Tax=Ktedonosporobacter rubrisoli TaxID=2509675 RepID=A0A4P6JIE9_KTERU|nr:MFS transporter [Ktedonosporobacter rubrisoli]QBD74682.1 MFS transporter [Ktedonosporobacter rubrisoli]
MNKLLRSQLFLMALTIFIDITGFGLILPQLPFWAERLGANPVGVGLILTVYALAQFLFTSVLGSLSDRYGRRPIIIGSLLIEALSFAFSALAGSLLLLLIARFIGGIGASNMGSAQAVVADTTPAEHRARGMGVIGAAIGLGFVVGPALGGVLAALSFTIPFWVAMGVAILNALLVFLFLPETRLRDTSQATTYEGVTLLAVGWRQLLKRPAVARLIGINLLFTIAFTSMEAIYPLFTQRTFGWTAVQNGYMFTYIGILIVIMQGGLIGRLVRRWGERCLLLAGLFMLALGLALLAWGSQLVLMLIALALLSLGEGAVTPVVSTLLSFASPQEEQGETLGLAQGIGGLGRVIGPVIAGALFATASSMGTFLVAAGLIGLALIIALPEQTKPQKTAPLPAARE